MKILNYIPIFLALTWVMAGCGSESKNTQSSPVPQKEKRPLGLPTVEAKPSNWYIRLTAEDPAKGLNSGSAQLGQLNEDDAVQKHTLKALSPFGGNYLDVVFADPDGVASGNYKVNFHSFKEGAEDRWRFTVRTDDAHADILLRWRGVYVLTPYVDEQNRQRYKEYRSTTNPLIKNMKLVDSSNQNEAAAVVGGQVQNYSFNMEGKTERTFEWVVQTEEVLLPTQISKISTLKAKAMQKDAALKKAEMMESKAEMFDLNKPPMIMENDYGK